THCVVLRAGGPDTPIWSIGGSTSDAALRFKRGDAIEVALANQLPVPAVLNWRGLEGVPAAQRLAAGVGVTPFSERQNPRAWPRSFSCIMAGRPTLSPGWSLQRSLPSATRR